MLRKVAKRSSLIGMSERRAVTLRLPAEDFARLETEARRAGVRPGTLARLLIHRYLQGPAREPRSALERLGELRADLPLADAVEIVRAGRAELDGRRGERLR